MKPMRLLLASCITLVSVVACGDNLTPPSQKGNYVGASPTPLPCVPNLDGKIDANELAPALGVTANFLVSPVGKTRAVDLVGGVNDGKTTWTLNQDYPDDAVAPIVATPLKGKWYESSFPGFPDAFVVPIDAGDTSEGVYIHDDTAFSLVGIASTKPDPATKILLPYVAPVALYRFPLEPGQSYTTQGEVQNGTVNGLPYAGRDTYEVKVDAAGTLVLKDFTFTQAIRVKTKVTISPSAGIVQIHRQTSFFSECLGEVTRATSATTPTDDTPEDFTTAAELRRLGQQ
jgi:hypothetical protein